MKLSGLFGGVFKAPFLAIAGGILRLLFSAPILLANILIHLFNGFKHGVVSHAVVLIAKYVPIACGLGRLKSALPLAAVFGSAHWASRRELQQPSSAKAGLLIGRDPSTGKLLRYSGPAHLPTIAPTPTGKGVGTIFNLLTADRPVICIDPKGGNATMTIRAKHLFGPVHVLDPFGITGPPSAAFNPLDGIEPAGLDVAEDPSAVAHAIVQHEQGMAGEVSWNDEAKAMKSCVCPNSG